MSDGPYSPLTRKVGAVHLVAAAILNAAVAVHLLVLVPRHAVFRAVFDAAADSFGEYAVLGWAPFLRVVVVHGPILVGGIALVLAVLGVRSGLAAYRGTDARPAVGYGIANATLLVGLPVALVGAILVTMARKQFDNSESAGSAAEASSPTGR